MATLSMTRGDTRYFMLTVQENGAPVDISGCALVFNAKCEAFPQISFSRSTVDGSVTLTDPTHGIAQLEIAPAVTLALPNQQYDLDCRWVLTDTRGNVSTIEADDLTILATLTVP